MENDSNDATLMRIADVRKELGNVSDMFIARRLADDPQFPKPIYIRTRRFWKRGEIARYKLLKAAGNERRQLHGVGLGAVA